MIDLIVYPLVGVASFFLLKWLYNEIFGRVVTKPEPEPILDEDDYLMFDYLIPPSKINYGRISRYYDGETVLKNKDMSLAVYVSLTTERILCIANTVEMYNRIVEKSKQLEEEVRTLINLGVLKEVPVCEVPAFRHFLLDRKDPAKVIEFLRTEKAHSHLTKGTGFYIPSYNPDTQEFGVKKNEGYLALSSDCPEIHTDCYKILQPNDKVFIKIKLF